jgi:phosphoribosylanthranilate isomerase
VQQQHAAKETTMNVTLRAQGLVQASLVATGLLVFAPSHASVAATAAISEAGEVMLVNVKTGKCLTIAGGVSTDNNVEALQFDCDSDPSRRWTLSNETGDIYQIKNVQTGKCLTIAGGVSTDNNVTALQFDCDSDPSRRWRVVDVTGAGVYQIRNVQTNKCLTIAGGVSTANNVTALQFNCDGDPSRRWTMRLKL